MKGVIRNDVGARLPVLHRPGVVGHRDTVIRRCLNYARRRALTIEPANAAFIVGGVTNQGLVQGGMARLDIGPMRCSSPSEHQVDRNNRYQTARRHFVCAAADARILARVRHLFADGLPRLVAISLPKSHA